MSPSIKKKIVFIARSCCIKYFYKEFLYILSPLIFTSVTLYESSLYILRIYSFLSEIPKRARTFFQSTCCSLAYDHLRKGYSLGIFSSAYIHTYTHTCARKIVECEKMTGCTSRTGASSRRRRSDPLGKMHIGVGEIKHVEFRENKIEDSGRPADSS